MKKKRFKPDQKIPRNDQRADDDAHTSTMLLDHTSELQQRIAELNGNLRSNRITVDEYKSMIHSLYAKFMSEVKDLHIAVKEKPAANRKRNKKS